LSSALAVYHGAFGRVTLYQLNKPMQTHAHREGHLIFQVAGPCGFVEVSGQAHPQTPTQAVAINPWEPHAFHPGESAGGGLFLVLYINPLWFLGASPGGRGALRFGRTPLAVDGPVAEAVVHVTTLLQRAHLPDGFEATVRHLADVSLEATWSGLDRPRPILIGEAGRDFRVRKAVRLLADHLGGDVDLDRIARESGLSRPHFYKLFRAHVGVTPHMYLNTLRMERAVECLSRTDRSVTDIAYDLGFTSQSVFTRVFAANVGMAPSDYRRAARVVQA
jgi:AraC-like DNA-binding protein